MRDNDELRAYLRDLSHTDDNVLCEQLESLIDGDESLRDEVEEVLDTLDDDCTDECFTVEVQTSFGWTRHSTWPTRRQAEEQADLVHGRVR